MGIGISIIVAAIIIGVCIILAPVINTKVLTYKMTDEKVICKLVKTMAKSTREYTKMMADMEYDNLDED